MVASSQEASRETENEFLVCSQQSLQPLCLSFHSFSCPRSVWLHLHTNSMPAIQIITLPFPPTALELTGPLEHLPCPFTPGSQSLISRHLWWKGQGMYSQV